MKNDATVFYPDDWRGSAVLGCGGGKCGFVGGPGGGLVTQEEMCVVGFLSLPASVSVQILGEKSRLDIHN